jgi:hypothetical protein
MKNVSLKLEQTKKSKSGNSLVTLRTVEKQFNDDSEAVNIVLEFINAISENLNLAREMNANGVKIGGVNFSFNAKFILYVSIDGNDYSLDDVKGLWDNADIEQSSFKNGKALFVSIYRILRKVEGKSIALTSEATKQATKLLSI